MIAQQFTGCTAVFAYSTDMFLNAGLNLELARLCTLGIGIVYFLCACSSPFLINRFGRRSLLLFQLGCCMIALLLLSGFTFWQNCCQVGWTRYGTIVSLIFYMCVYGVGSPIPWIIASELFTQKESWFSIISITIIFSFGQRQ
uniref:Major facilitator superfamily (MFS) profile domain-containing protein n=1 Tax=Caenorhabditis japonica TaxID=281687 RepID=A0A8R1ECL5_CAEJA